MDCMIHRPHKLTIFFNTRFILPPTWQLIDYDVIIRIVTRIIIVVEPVVERAGDGVAGRQVGHGNVPLPQRGDAGICRKWILIT